jgi:hypothetical protein
MVVAALRVMRQAAHCQRARYAVCLAPKYGGRDERGGRPAIAVTCKCPSFIRRRENAGKNTGAIAIERGDDALLGAGDDGPGSSGRSRHRFVENEGPRQIAFFVEMPHSERDCYTSLIGCFDGIRPLKARGSETRRVGLRARDPQKGDEDYGCRDRQAVLAKHRFSPGCFDRTSDPNSLDERSYPPHAILCPRGFATSCPAPRRNICLPHAFDSAQARPCAPRCGLKVERHLRCCLTSA